MKKITFIINDCEYFKKLYNSAENLSDILADIKPFKAIYTLIGKDGGSMADRYELTTAEGEKLNINDLNGYERGVILNECAQYFNGKRNFDGGKMPCGVIEIR